MSFTRVVENFECDHCGAHVQGAGYTNHCPECLWSKHVDNDPGDRAAVCGGLMRPVRVEGSTPNYRVVHRCEKCGIERVVCTAPNDSLEALIAIMQRVARAS